MREILNRGILFQILRNINSGFPCFTFLHEVSENVSESRIIIERNLVVVEPITKNGSGIMAAKKFALGKSWMIFSFMVNGTCMLMEMGTEDTCFFDRMYFSSLVSFFENIENRATDFIGATVAISFLEILMFLRMKNVSKEYHICYNTLYHKYIKFVWDAFLVKSSKEDCKIKIFCYILLDFFFFCYGI